MSVWWTVHPFLWNEKIKYSLDFISELENVTDFFPNSPLTFRIGPKPVWKWSVTTAHSLSIVTYCEITITVLGLSMQSNIFLKVWCWDGCAHDVITMQSLNLSFKQHPRKCLHCNFCQALAHITYIPRIQTTGMKGILWMNPVHACNNYAGVSTQMDQNLLRNTPFFVFFFFFFFFVLGNKGQ